MYTLFLLLQVQFPLYRVISSAVWVLLGSLFIQLYLGKYFFTKLYLRMFQMIGEYASKEMWKPLFHFK